MINEIIDKHFIDNARLALEHKDRLYPTHASVYINYPKYKKLQGHCMRATYYSCLGFSEDIENKTNQNLTKRYGDYIEKMLLHILKEQNVLIDSGVKFEIEKYKIFGKLDAIVKIDGVEKGLEVKTINSNKYTINQVFGSPWNEPTPKWNHLFQTLIYCYAFRERIEEFILYYMRRDTGETKEFIISTVVDKGKTYPVINGKTDYRYTINDILDRYEILLNHINLGTPPQVEYMKVYPANKIKDFVSAGFLSRRQAEMYKESPFGDWECRVCGFKDLCDRDK